MTDPLADVIALATVAHFQKRQKRRQGGFTESEFIAAAVRAHLAAVLDAEEALVGTFSMRPYDIGRLDVLARIRSALGLSAPGSLPGTDGPSEPVAGDLSGPSGDSESGATLEDPT